MSTTRGLGFIRKRYEVIEEIGQGGMGVVYKAHDTQLERDVAIKVILPHFSQQPEFKQSFEKEAKSLATLEHPNIISIYDYQSVKRGSYYVMPFIDGKTLKEFIEEQLITPELFLKIAQALLSALDFAHAKGIIHRDIKPANVFINQSNQVFLGDFGVLVSQANSGQITSSQQINFQGTPAYASPEQIEGQPLSLVSDIYSLGILFYEMLSGHPPFSGNLNSVISAQLTKEPPLIDVAAVDQRLRHIPLIIERMLKKIMGERIQSCREVLYLIEHPEEVKSSQTASDELLLQPLAEEASLEQKAEHLSRKIEATKNKFDETEKLLAQLLENQAKIDKNMFRELKRKYRKGLDKQVAEMEIFSHDARACVTEFDLRLKNNRHSIKKVAHELNGYKLLQANPEDETDYSEKIDAAETSLESLRRQEELLQQQHDSLKRVIAEGHISRKQTKAEKMLSYFSTVAASFIGFFLVYILFVAITTTPGKIVADSITIYKNHSILSPPAGRAWKKEVAVIYKKYRRAYNEGVVVRNSFLEAGINLLEIAKGEKVQIVKVLKDRYLVSYRKKGKGLITQAKIRKTAVRKNSWYRVKTESGAKGWVFAEHVRPWRKASIIKKFVFSLQNFFSVSRAKRKPIAVAVDPNLKPIRHTVQNKVSQTIVKQKLGKYKLDFAFYLDLFGANAIATALAREIHLASLTGLTSKVDTLEKIREKFVADEFRQAKKLIKGVFLAASFNGWSREKGVMKISRLQGVELFSYSATVPITEDKVEYGFYFKLALGTRELFVFVPDPLNVTKSQDIYQKKSFIKVEQKKARIKMIKLSAASVNSTSVAKDSSVLNLSDDMTSSSWASSVLNGGVGSTLSFSFSRKMAISEIEIFNGHSSKKEFFKFNRAARLQITMDKTKKVIILRDYMMQGQRFTFAKPVICAKVEIVLDAVYPGNPGQQTAISEIVFKRRGWAR